MAITCARCGAGFDVTLFQFGNRIRCHCGAWVDLATGHVLAHHPDASGGDTPGETSDECFPSSRSATMAEQEIGKVTHYFGKIGVAAIQITSGTLSVGDVIHIKGHTTDFTQTVESMQIEKESIQQASAGQAVGIKVKEHAREHDVVYKVLPD